MDKSILLIELDEDSAAALRNDLSMLGAEVTVSPSAELATALVLAGLQPDAVLIVWNEGSMGTPKLPTALRDHLPDTPFVLVLPEGIELPEETTSALRIHSTLTRPFPVSKLAGVLDEAANQVSARASDIEPSQTVDSLDDTNPGIDWLDQVLSTDPEFVPSWTSATEKADEGHDEASSELEESEATDSSPLSGGKRLYDSLASDETDQTDEPPPAKPRDIPMSGGHIRLSQQRIDHLGNALRSYTSSQKNMILLLSQSGELVALAGDISREAAATIALQVDLERRQRADQADDWYYTSDLIRDAGDDEGPVEFCAMRVAGDLILSMHSDVSTSRSMLHDMALEVVDALSLIVMAIETGEIDLRQFDYADPSEPSTPDISEVEILDQESVQSIESVEPVEPMESVDFEEFEKSEDLPAVADHEAVEQPADIDYGDDLDWLTFDEKPPAELPAEPPTPPAETGFEDLLAFIRTGESAPSAPREDTPTEPPESPTTPKSEEMLEDIREDAERGASVPSTLHVETPDESQSLGAGIADIAKSDIQEPGEDIGAEVIEAAPHEPTGRADDSVRAAQERAEIEEEEGLDDDFFTVADLVFDRLGISSDEQTAEETLDASATATQPDELANLLSEDDFLAEAEAEITAAWDPAAAAYSIAKPSTTETRDEPPGESRPDETATDSPSHQHRSLRSVFAWTRSLPKDVSISLAGSRRKLKGPWVLALAAVVAIAPFVISVVLLTRNPQILSRFRPGTDSSTQTPQAESFGLKLGLPEGWLVADHDTTGTLPPDMTVTFAAPDAETLAALEDSFDEGPLSLSGPVIIGIVRTKGVQAETDPTTLLMALQADWPAGEMQFDPPVRVRINDNDAAVANFTVENPETGSTVRGRLVVVVWSGQADYLIGTAPDDQWDAFAPTFDAIIDSNEFLLPTDT
jgi:hypothetical protein